MIRTHDSVVLTCDLPKIGLIAGDVGVVVQIYGDGAAYEVEFIRYDGRMMAVETLEAASVRSVGADDIPHVRELPAGSALTATATTGIRKGIYRFKSHDEMNRHTEEAQARALALNAREREGKA